MPRPSPYTITLSAKDRAVLEERARTYTASYAQVVRAKIVLLAADGAQNIDIAARLDVDVDVASRWRKRFYDQGLGGLVDRPRAGRPPRFSPLVLAQVKATACEPAAGSEVPLGRWSCPELARTTVERGVVESISASTIRRVLAEDPIKPWQHRSWSSPRDPDFAAKAARVLACTPAAGTGSRCPRTTWWSARTRRPASKPGVAAIPPCHRARPERCGSNTTTAGAVRWPTWPPGTSTAVRSVAAVSPPPASNRSAGSSSR